MMLNDKATDNLFSFSNSIAILWYHSWYPFKDTSKLLEKHPVW